MQNSSDHETVYLQAAPAALKLAPLSVAPRSVAEAQINAALMALAQDDWLQAQARLESALALAPRNVAANFLYAFTHHQLGLTADPRHFSTAAVGYGLALEFDPQAWWVAYHYGEMELERENYLRACDLFAQASEIEPNSAPALLGLAICSYYLGDLNTAAHALRNAKRVLGENPATLRTAIMISAASGEFDRARHHLDRYRAVTAHPAMVRRMQARIADWERSLSGQARETQTLLVPTSTREASEPDTRDIAPETSEQSQQRQIVIEATILRTTNSLVNSSGLNLLDGLNALFSYADDRTLSQSSGEDDSITRSITRSISSSELEYSLNIFQATNDWSEIVARPTLIAMEDKPSSFFSGDLFLASITGQFDGETLTERVGVTVEVTPQFVSDEEFILEIALGNSDFSTEAIAGTFQEALSISASETKVNVRIRLGQTLLLAGLRERRDRVKEEKVPVLGDIPVLQNLFRTQEVQDVAAETIILLTPRRVIEFDEEAIAGSGAIRELASPLQLSRRRDFVPVPRMRGGSPYNGAFRRGDLSMPDWAGTKQQQAMWDEVLAYIQFR